MPTVLVLATFADAVPSRADARAADPRPPGRRPGRRRARGGRAEAAAAILAAHGATRVLSVQDPAFDAFLVAPKSEALDQVADGRRPGLVVLLTSGVEGKEVAGRLAVRLGASLVTDAVDLDADGTATKSVLAGGWTTRCRGGRDVAVVTVKPNSVTPEPVAARSHRGGRGVRRHRLRRGPGGPDHGARRAGRRADARA